MLSNVSRAIVIAMLFAGCASQKQFVDGLRLGAKIYQEVKTAEDQQDTAKKMKEDCVKQSIKKGGLAYLAAVQAGKKPAEAIIEAEAVASAFAQQVYNMDLEATILELSKGDDKDSKDIYLGVLLANIDEIADVIAVEDPEVATTVTIPAPVITLPDPVITREQPVQIVEPAAPIIVIGETP